MKCLTSFTADQYAHFAIAIFLFWVAVVITLEYRAIRKAVDDGK